jgi:hypothetical protein
VGPAGELSLPAPWGHLGSTARIFTAGAYKPGTRGCTSLNVVLAYGRAPAQYRRFPARIQNELFCGLLLT